MNKISKYLLGIAAIAFIYLPILWLFLASIRSDNEFYRGSLSFIPQNATLDIYSEIFFNLETYQTALLNAFITSLFASIIGVTTGTAIAFCFVQGTQFKTLSKSVGIAIVSSRFLPIATLIPGLYWFFKWVNLLDTIYGLVLIQAISALSLSFILMSPVLATIRKSHIQQAEIEGARGWDILRWVLWPNIRFPILLVSLINFAITWNEYFLTNMLCETSACQTISIIVAAGVGQFRVRYPLLAAGGLLSIVPALLITGILLLLALCRGLNYSAARPSKFQNNV